MTYDLSPQIVRLTPFQNEGGALAAVDIQFGPIVVRAKLYKSASGFFLSMPARKSEQSDKWFDHVVVSDLALKLRAQELAVKQYERLSRGELVAV